MLLPLQALAVRHLVLMHLMMTAAAEDVSETVVSMIWFVESSQAKVYNCELRGTAGSAVAASTSGGWPCSDPLVSVSNILNSLLESIKQCQERSIMDKSTLE